jgi:hypothetical protein
MTIKDSVLYVRGDVENEGTLSIASGRLFLDEGNLTNKAAATWITGLGTVVMIGTTSHSLNVNGATLHHLRLDNPAGTLLASNATMNGALMLAQGHLKTTAAFSLTLDPTAVLFNETDAHYVQGSLRQTQAMAGSSVVDFGKMGFTINPQGQTFTLQVERRTGLNQLNYSYGQSPLIPGNQGIDRVWILATSNGLNPSGPVSLTLSWLADNDHSLNFNTSLAQVWRSTDLGQTWLPEGGLQSGVARSLTITPTVLNAWYTVSSAAQPLPVQLSEFSATARQLDAVLKWSTASELHSAWFAVERSWTGQDWQEISRQPAAGQSSATRAYSAVDKQVGRQASQAYYRLRQIDQDGSTTYSVVRAVQFAKASEFDLVAYPVPLQQYLTLDLITSSAGPVDIAIYDASGRLMLGQQAAAPIGTSRYQLNVGPLAAGVYTLSVRQGSQKLSRKLLRN